MAEPHPIYYGSGHSVVFHTRKDCPGFRALRYPYMLQADAAEHQARVMMGSTPLSEWFPLKMRRCHICTSRTIRDAELQLQHDRIIERCREDDMAKASEGVNLRMPPIIHEAEATPRELKLNGYQRTIVSERAAQNIIGSICRVAPGEISALGEEGYARLHDNTVRRVARILREQGW